MADVPDIRIGTAEREQALTALTEHFAAGRVPVYHGRQLVAYVDDPEDLPHASFVERDGRLAVMLNVWKDSADQIAA